MAKPNDSPDNFFLDLEVPASRMNFDPIDSLQILFNQWKQTVGIPKSEEAAKFEIFISANAGHISVFVQNFETVAEGLQLNLYSLTGQVLEKTKIRAPQTTLTNSRLEEGIYLVTIADHSGRRLMTKKVAIF